MHMRCNAACLAREAIDTGNSLLRENIEKYREHLWLGTENQDGKEVNENVIK